LLKPLLQVLAYARLTKMANGLDSTQKKLSNETLIKINGVISAEV